MEHISIHALREEGDGAPHPAGARTQHFYPRPPRGGRRSRNSSFGKSKVFLSTPSARRATTRGLRRSCRGPISIHALREEGDVQHHANVFDLAISIHALREEGDASGWCSLVKTAHFYPRPPRGGRRVHRRVYGVLEGISIHALREEGDWDGNNFILTYFQFLSTPSARRATYARRRRADGYVISIHALREEGDLASLPLLQIQTYFYPRPPRGGRHNPPGQGLQLLEISIHALREEGDGLRL